MTLYCLANLLFVLLWLVIRLRLARRWRRNCFLCGYYAVYYELGEASPRQCSEVFLVVQFYRLAALQHQFLGDAFVVNRELEFVGLDRAGCAGADSRLYQFALVGLEQHSFVDDIVQFAALYSFAEYEVEFEIYEYGQRHYDYCGQYSPHSFHFMDLLCFVVICVRSPCRLKSLVLPIPDKYSNYMCDSRENMLFHLHGCRQSQYEPGLHLRNACFLYPYHVSQAIFVPLLFYGTIWLDIPSFDGIAAYSS